MMPSELRSSIEKDSYMVEDGKFEAYVLGVTEKGESGYLAVVSVCDPHEGQEAEPRLEILVNWDNRDIFGVNDVVEIGCHRFTTEKRENGLPRIRLLQKPSDGSRITGVI